MKIINPFSITIYSLVLFTLLGCNRSPSTTADAGKEEMENKTVTPALKSASDPVSEEALRQAALDGNIDQVNSLLESGTKVDAPDTDGHTALMFAARGGHFDVRDYLMEKGAK